jgi:serine/threonine-protein kinase RsbW
MCFTEGTDQSHASSSWEQERIRESRYIASLIARVCDAMAAAGYGSQDLFAFRLALDEAISNAIIHGNRRDATREVTVSYRVSATRIVATVQDEGQGFDLANIPDPLAPENFEQPSGRGILLMRHYTTRLRFNQIGNCVTLCRKRTHDSCSPPPQDRKGIDHAFTCAERDCRHE